MRILVLGDEAEYQVHARFFRLFDSVQLVSKVINLTNAHSLKPKLSLLMTL